MVELFVSLPLRGLSDEQAFSDQAPETTRAALNFRASDPFTGRVRGGQRPGLAKLVTTAVMGTNKVVDLVSVTTNVSGVTYAERSDATISADWANKTPSGKACLNIQTDRQSNVYALDGDGGLVKYNSEGELVYKLPFPVTEPGQIVRALHVDEFDGLFAGVSAVGDSRRAKLWGFSQKIDGRGADVLFELEPGGFIEEIRTFEDKLYVLVNRTPEWRAEVVVYEEITTTNPRETARWSVSYPANGMDVSADGVFTAHEAFSKRGISPLEPEISLPIVADGPRELIENFEGRCWAWLDAEDINGNGDGNAGFTENDPIFVWYDKSGNGRNLYWHRQGTNQSPPTYIARALAGKPGISLRTNQSFISSRGTDVTKSAADQQKTLIPSYSGAAYAAFFAVRPPSESPNSKKEILFIQDSIAGTHEYVAFNASDKNQVDGSLTYNTRKTGTMPSFAYTGERPMATIVCVLNDGGLNPGSNGTGTVTRSLLRVNGVPVDRFEANARTSRESVVVGHRGPLKSAVWDGFHGDILEIIVFDRKDRMDSGATGATVLKQDGAPDYATSIAQADNEMTQMEAYLMYKWGLGHSLPTSQDDYAHPYGWTSSARGTNDPAQFNVPPGAETGKEGALFNRRARLLCWDPGTKKLRWASQHFERVGYGVRADTNAVWSAGSKGNYTGQSAAGLFEGVARHATTGAFVWKTNLSFDDNKHVRLDFDRFENLYVPAFDASGPTFTFKVYGASGTNIATKLIQTGQQAYAIAVDKAGLPDYGTNNVAIAEAIFVGTATGSTGRPTVHKMSLVSKALNSLPPRKMSLLAVSQGTIRKMAGTGTWVTVSGGTGALATGRYVESVAAYQKVFWVDGKNEPYRYYDAAEGKELVQEWKATSAGKIPPRARLINVWRGRIVLARATDDPQNWHMSAIGDPFDWDQFPRVPSAAQAISGNNAPAGQLPDIVNSLIPYDDDFLFFGGDHSIWILRGDPMAGGQLDLVSDITGTSFGRPWCKDPTGRIFFFGSRGGLYTLSPGGGLERISERRIERRLQDVDLSTHFVRMAWDWRQEGLAIYQIPFGSTGVVKHWFFDTKSGGFWEDEINSASKNPSSLLVMDGDDPDDRRLILGCGDGFVRVVSESARDDDGTAIDSHILLGPIAPRESGFEHRFTRFDVALAADQDGAILESFASDDADVLGPAEWYVPLQPGRNIVRERMRGAYAWLRLRNAVAGQRFALESLALEASAAGRKRPRVT